MGKSLAQAGCHIFSAWEPCMATRAISPMHRPLSGCPSAAVPLLEHGTELGGSCNKELLASSCSSLLVKGWWPHHSAAVLHFRGKQNNPDDSHLPSLPRERGLRGGQGCCVLSKSDICSLPGGTYSLSTSVTHWSCLLRGIQEKQNIPKEIYVKRENWS